MSLASAITPAILDTVLGRLALLFLSGANGDLTTARHAAARMLAAYGAETEDELRLAAEIISFSFHALEALSQAATPDMPLNKILRLRGGAVSLSRESHKAERRLGQLQAASRAGMPIEAPEAAQAATAQPEPPPARPHIDNAIALVEATRDAIATGGRPAAIPWTQASQKREAARRITENLKRNQAAHCAATQAAATV